MKFSTRSEYGLRALAILEAAYGEGPIPLRQIANAEGISEHYLEQLFRDLRSAGIIASVRGTSGGYHLAKAPGEIDLLQIITALEGEIAPCDCVREDELSHCLRGKPCKVQAVWLHLKDSMHRILEGITLSDMCAGRIYLQESIT